jgi:hypothetical protein
LSQVPEAWGKVHDQDGKKIAKANSTCFVLRGEQTKIR